MTLSGKCISVSKAVTECVFQKQILGNGFDSCALACQKAHFRRHRGGLLFLKGACFLACQETKLLYFAEKVCLNHNETENWFVCHRFLGEKANKAVHFLCET